jgi:hypothetical protein
MRVGCAVLGFSISSVFLGCGPPEQVEVAGVVRDGRTGAELARAEVRASGGGRATTDENGRFALRIPIGDDRVIRAAAREHCPGDTTVDVMRRNPEEITVNLFPRLELEEEHLQVGFGREIQIEARTRCDDQENLRWTQIAGPELTSETMRVEDGGRRVSIQIPPLERVVELGPRVSAVALSRADRYELRLEMQASLGGKEERRVVRVTAAAPSPGIFQVPTGQDLYLNGGERESHRWSLVSKPDGSRAEIVDPESRTPHLRPDRFGEYLVRYEPLSLDINVQAGAYDDVPRDCGREGCHRPEEQGWKTTAHAVTFRRGLEGGLGESFDERCWGCHATGVDRGVANGGFHEVAKRIGWQQPEPHPGAWDEAPRQVRRFGSVWCSSCHGPGRILPPPFHWEYQAKMGIGTCAQCHDAVGEPDAASPSWHVREYRRAPMASFVGGGRDPGPAARAECASCHSAQGYVAWRDRGEHITPDAATVEPITCSACHDPHDGTNPYALRVFDVAEVSGAEVHALGTGAVCATCHQAGVTDEEHPSRAPHAPQTDVLLGRGSLLLGRPKGGVHAQLANACVACHMAIPGADDPIRGRAGAHTFSVRDLGATGARPILAQATCGACHGTSVPPQAIGGYRDWDGDGVSDNVGEELGRALAAVRSELRTRIAYARVHDECGTPHLGVDYVEHDAQLVLVDGEGKLLGDCDRDGRLAENEPWVGVAQLSRELRKVVWDVAMLEKDGSHGRHNPTFAFEILRAAERELR